MKFVKYLLLLIIGVSFIVFLVNDKGVDVQERLEAFTIATNQEEIDNSSKKFDKAIVNHVIDGDTIEVSLNDENITVRMIGINTPESVHPDESKNTQEGLVASDFTKEKLIAGQVVYLEYDKEKTDKYGRTLAYVWLDDNVDTTSKSDIKKEMFNAILLSEGYAEIMTIEPNTKYSDIFENLE